MKNKKWVQHISGKGEKWEIEREETYTWLGSNGRIVCHLPKSEYKECEGPELWEEVTEHFYATGNWPSEIWSKSNGIANYDNNMFWTPCEVHNRGGYRLRKVKCNYVKEVENRGFASPDEVVSGWAFIIEQKVS